MSSTIKLSDTMNFAAPFVRFQPMNIGANNEPALSSANIILSTMLSPPFTWRWNRVKATFNTSAGTQDYLQNLADYGFLEKTSVTASNAAFEVPQMTTILGAETSSSRPVNVAPYLDNNSGGITFRFMPVPDATYATEILYQKKPTLMTSTTSTWAPIPDEYSYIYNHGFLALMFLYFDDSRANVELPRFVASLLSVSEGLNEQQKNSFRDAWLMDTAQMQTKMQKAAQGVQAK